MAKSIGELAGAGVVVNNQPWVPKMETDCIEYIEVHSDFRTITKDYPVDTYIVNIPRKWQAGIAVQVAEGSEIPKARDVFDAIQVTLRQNGTGIRMTDEEQEKFNDIKSKIEERKKTTGKGDKCHAEEFRPDGQGKGSEG